MEYEIDLIRQLSIPEVTFKSIAPPVSKKRKRAGTDDESDAKRKKPDDSPAKEQEGGLDPISEVLEVDFGEELLKPPSSSLVPIARPEAESIDFGTPSIDLPPALKTKKTVTPRKKCPKPPQKEPTVVERLKETGSVIDVESVEIMSEAFEEARITGPRKEACFYEKQGLDYSSCEEEDPTESDYGQQQSPASVVDDMFAMDLDLEPEQMPTVKLVKRRKTRNFKHNDYVKIDAECVYCHPIKVNKIFDQRSAAAFSVLMDSSFKARVSAKKAHLLYKQGYNSLTVQERVQFNVPMMTSRHMIRHIGDHSTDPDCTSRRMADEHELAFDEMKKYRIVETEAGPMPNTKVVEIGLKLGKEVVAVRTKLYSKQRVTPAIKTK